MARFSHLTGSTERFPDLSTVNAYKFNNGYDYAQFDNTQMLITLCRVPWDMGEVRVGIRTVSGIGNVVHFGSKEARDKWFDGLEESEHPGEGECIRFKTEYRKLHTDNYLDIELPFDIASLYNYISVEYTPVANAEHLVKHETAIGGFKHWFWFVREVERLANNTTRLHLLPDSWQTFIYDFPIKSMFLERGHMPMFQTSADTYLSNPVNNSSWLLTEDANFSEPRISKHTSSFLLNAKNVVAVIVSSANPTADFGTKAANTWHTPNGVSLQHGAPGYWAFYCNTGSLNALINNINAQVPQFMQTIKAVFFVSNDLVYSGAAFSFCGVSCTWVSNTYSTNRLYKLSKGDFGYPARYANIAKLYTYPYAVLQVTDETGGVTEIRIEDTDGTLNIETAYSLAFPWIRLDAHITGVGKAARKTLTWHDIGSRAMDIQGNWFELLHSWSIPTLGITQSAATVNDYTTHFDRAQTALQNSTAQADANALANTAAAIAQAQIAASNAMNAANVAKLNSDNAANIAYQSDMSDMQIAHNNNMTNSEMTLARQNAAIAQMTNGVQAGMGAVGSLLSLDVGGAIGSLVQGGVNAAATEAQLNATIGATTVQNAFSSSFNFGGTNKANANSTLLNGYMVDNENARTAAGNTLTSTSSALSVATQIENAARDRSTADMGITNQIRQAALGAPSEFGQFANGEHMTTRPQGLFANVVTQPDNAIMQAGDTFLRYGYMLNRVVDFVKWHYGKYFTFWQCSDFWTEGNAIPDLYADRLRYFLLGGVTVWRRPEDIGRVTIYDNI